eukprot:Colp12_sorted_trinity150504_noHs@6852
MAIQTNNTGNNTVDELAKKLLSPAGTQIALCGLSGYIAGYAAKKIGKAALLCFATGFLLIQGAGASGVIKIDWKLAQEKAVAVLDQTGDGKVDEKDLKEAAVKAKEVFVQNMPASASFTAGFAVGLLA